MLMGNRVEFVELVVGALALRRVAHPVNWHLTADEVAYILDDSGARVLFTDASYDGTAPRRPPSRPGAVVVAGPELDARWPRPATSRSTLDGPAGGTMLYTQRHDRPAQGREAHPRSRPSTARCTVGRPPAWGSASTAEGPHLVHRPAVPRRPARLRGRSTCSTGRRW